MTPAEMSSAIVGWSMSFGRSFPWRDSRDPYVLAVAEVLLQKTKAPDVEPVWRTLIERYPTADSLVDADNESLHALVASLGLGLQRTTRLRRMATAIASGDSTPRLGPYGDAMVSMALEDSTAAVPVDGNVARIVQRVLGLSWERGEVRKKREVRTGAKALLDANGSSESRLKFMYGLLDFGAAICTASRPRCGDCPLASGCVTRSREAGFDA